MPSQRCACRDRRRDGHDSPAGLRAAEPRAGLAPLECGCDIGLSFPPRRIRFGQRRLIRQATRREVCSPERHIFQRLCHFMLNRMSHLRRGHVAGTNGLPLTRLSCVEQSRRIAAMVVGH